MEAESSWVMEAGSIWEYQQIKLKTSQNNALNEEHDILILQTMRKKNTPTEQPAKSLVQPNAAASGRQEKNRKPAVEDLYKYPQMTPKLPDVFLCVFFLPYVNFKLHSYGKSPF